MSVEEILIWLARAKNTKTSLSPISAYSYLCLRNLASASQDMPFQTMENPMLRWLLIAMQSLVLWRLS